VEYTEEQIKFIQENYPDFGFKIIPSLDSVVVEFLKKYEVFVKPMTSGTRDVKGDITSGVITGVLGADVGMDAYGVTGQKKQTEVQEWTQWKQWALNHKDFEDFRVEKIELPKAHNLQVLEKLKNPQIQKELEPLMEEFKEFEQNQLRKDNRMGFTKFIFLAFIFVVFILPIFSVLLDEFLKEDKNQSSLREQINLVQRS